MPSQEWFQQNPKVSAYIPPELNEKLEEWMEAERIKSKSQALIFILNEYFGSRPIHLQPKGRKTDQRVESLEKKVANLEQQLEWIAQMMRGEISA